ncbi:MAG: hypothetical protein AB7F98_01920 [Novosphingobium sp.]
MAWPSGHLGKLCAFDLAASGVLAAMVTMQIPSEQVCAGPQDASALAKPGFQTLDDPAPLPSCLRIRLR